MKKVYTAFITVKGRRIYAKDVGKKAFVFYVTQEQHEEYLKRKQKEKESKNKK